MMFLWQLNIKSLTITSLLKFVSCDTRRPARKHACWKQALAMPCSSIWCNNLWRCTLDWLIGLGWRVNNMYTKQTETYLPKVNAAYLPKARRIVTWQDVCCNDVIVIAEMIRKWPNCSYNKRNYHWYQIFCLFDTHWTRAALVMTLKSPGISL